MSTRIPNPKRNWELVACAILLSWMALILSVFAIASIHLAINASSLSDCIMYSGGALVLVYCSLLNVWLAAGCIQDLRRAS